MNNKSRAFTLIELLVVIAIIAILAAILFPVFAQAKLAAKKTVALSSSKQIATAHAIYMGDYDDHVIKNYFGFTADPTCATGWGPDFYSWRIALMPYMKSTALLTDPTNPFAATTYWTSQDSVANTALSTNFAVNIAIIGFANGNSGCTGPYTPAGLDTIDGLQNPADTIMMLPNRSQYNDLAFYYASYGPTSYLGAPATLQDNWWCLAPNGTPVCPATGNGAIHSVTKQAAFIWCDTHAKFKSVSSTFNVTNATQDEWNASQTINNLTGKNYTQQDRLLVSQNLYPEYQ